MLLMLLLLLIIICQILPDRNLAPSPLLSFINNSQSLFFIFIATFIFKIFIFFLGFLGFNESRIVRNFTVISRFILYRYFCLAIHLLILWVQHRAGSVTAIFSRFDLIKTILTLSILGLIVWLPWTHFFLFVKETKRQRDKETTSTARWGWGEREKVKETLF